MSHKVEDEVDPWLGIKQQDLKPVNDLEDVQINPLDLTKSTKILKNRSGELRYELIDFLKRSRDLLAWAYINMKRIDLAIIFHALNIDLDAQPMGKKRRTLDEERYVKMLNSWRKMSSSMKYTTKSGWRIHFGKEVEREAINLRGFLVKKSKGK